MRYRVRRLHKTKSHCEITGTIRVRAAVRARADVRFRLRVSVTVMWMPRRAVHVRSQTHARLGIESGVELDTNVRLLLGGFKGPGQSQC